MPFGWHHRARLLIHDVQLTLQAVSLLCAPKRHITDVDTKANIPCLEDDGCLNGVICMSGSCSWTPSMLVVLSTHALHTEACVGISDYPSRYCPEGSLITVPWTKSVCHHKVTRGDGRWTRQHSHLHSLNPCLSELPLFCAKESQSRGCRPFKLTCRHPHCEGLMPFDLHLTST